MAVVARRPAVAHDGDDGTRTRRRDPARGWHLSAHAAQALMPRTLPRARGFHRRELARRREWSVADGPATRRLLSRLLLGAHAAAVLWRRDESDLDRAARNRGA